MHLALGCTSVGKPDGAEGGAHYSKPPQLSDGWRTATPEEIGRATEIACSTHIRATLVQPLGSGITGERSIQAS